MNLLFVDVHASLGGHTRTATSIAQALTEQGHQVTFVTSESSSSYVIEQAGFTIHKVGRAWTRRYPKLTPLIARLHQQQPLDAVHAFDWRGIPEALSAAKSLNIPFYQTICGGSGPNYAPLSKSIVSLSHEVKKKLVNTFNLSDDDVTVIPARMNLTQLTRQASSADTLKLSAFRQKYGLGESAKIIMRIVRSTPPYEYSLKLGADAAAKLFEQGHDIRFVHIGFVSASPDDVQSHERTIKHFREVNARVGTPICISVQDEALSALEYLHLADVALATGRAAFEAMAFAKPVVVAGVNGYAGMVSEQTTDDIAFYNVSGRNLAEPKPHERSVDELAQEIAALLNDPELCQQIADFGKHYLYQNLDVKVAAERYENLYRTFSSDTYPSDARLARSLKPKPRDLALTLIPERFHRRIGKVLRG